MVKRLSVVITSPNSTKRSLKNLSLPESPQSSPPPLSLEYSTNEEIPFSSRGSIILPRMFGSFTALSKTLSPEARKSSSMTTTMMMIGENDFSKAGTTIRQILDHDILGPRFRTFCRQSRCDEGIQFLDDLQVACSKPLHLHPWFAKEIMSKYFVRGALQWVNLSDPVRLTLEVRFATCKSMDGIDLYDLFEDAMYEIFADLKQSDAFRSFCSRDEEFKQFNAHFWLLDSFLCPQHFRVAMNAVSEDVNLINLVRFCCAVREFHDDQRSFKHKPSSLSIKTALSQHTIVETFLNPSTAKFPINSSSSSVIDTSTTTRSLSEIRIDVIQHILAKHETLLNVARRTLSLQAHCQRITRSSHSNKFNNNGGSSSSNGSSGSLFNVGATVLESVFAKEETTTMLMDKFVTQSNKMPPSVYHILNSMRFCAKVSFYFTALTKNKREEIVHEFLHTNTSFVVDLTREEFELGECDSDFDQVLTKLFDRMVDELAKDEVICDLASQIMKS